jgi:hypothetical protein
MSNIKSTILLGAVVLFALIGCNDTQSNSTSNYTGNGLSVSKSETPEQIVTVNGIEYSLNATANGYNAKNALPALEDATIESSIDGLPVSIKDRLFATNKKITSLTIKHGITQIPGMMCYQTTMLEKVTLPDTITSIASHAFAECAALKSVNIPFGVTSIADFTFKKSTALEEIFIPSSVTSIGVYSFVKCSSLKKINFSEGLQTIGSNAFSSAKALTEIVLPASVTSINYQAFSDCTALKSITVKAVTPPTLDDSAFIGIASDAVFYVPAESLEMYNAALGWSTLNLAAIQ